MIINVHYYCLSRKIPVKVLISATHMYLFYTKDYVVDPLSKGKLALARSPLIL